MIRLSLKKYRLTIKNDTRHQNLIIDAVDEYSAKIYAKNFYDCNFDVIIAEELGVSYGELNYE